MIGAKVLRRITKTEGKERPAALSCIQIDPNEGCHSSDGLMEALKNDFDLSKPKGLLKKLK